MRDTTTWPNRALQGNRRVAFQFVSHLLYNIGSFGARTLQRRALSLAIRCKEYYNEPAISHRRFDDYRSNFLEAAQRDN